MQPNILFITCHDLGQHLGCYGQETVRSPNVDTLAAQGVRFAQSFCTAPQCSPSRAGLHTGRYPHATGVLGLTHADFGWDLNSDETHLAKRLQSAGYATALVGIQHVTKAPERLGYDRIEPVKSAQREAEAAAHLLGELASGGAPFYLEVGFFEPHRPYDRWGIRPDDAQGVALPGYVPDCPEAVEEFAAVQGAIRAMDAAVGRILHALDEAGLRDDTWVIFTVDHGLAMPRAKCTLYDPGIETALIMRRPDAGIEGGVVYDELISNVDVVPTMLEGLGMGIPDEIQGRSFWSLIDPETSAVPYEPREMIFAEKSYHSYYHPQRAVRTPTHKLVAHFEHQPPVEVPGDVIRGPLYLAMAHDLIRRPRQRFELYDLVADPWEQESISGRPATAGTERFLKERLWQWMVETGDPLCEGPIRSPAYEETLAALGEAT